MLWKYTTYYATPSKQQNSKISVENFKNKTILLQHCKILFPFLLQQTIRLNYTATSVELSLSPSSTYNISLYTNVIKIQDEEEQRSEYEYIGVETPAASGTF